MLSDVDDRHIGGVGVLTYNVNEIQYWSTCQRLETKEGLRSFQEILKKKFGDEPYSKDDLLVADNADGDAVAVVDSSLQLILGYEEGCTDSRYL